VSYVVNRQSYLSLLMLERCVGGGISAWPGKTRLENMTTGKIGRQAGDGLERMMTQPKGG
jgi:hypothetical protein